MNRSRRYSSCRRCSSFGWSQCWTNQRYNSCRNLNESCDSSRCCLRLNGSWKSSVSCRRRCCCGCHRSWRCALSRCYTSDCCPSSSGCCSNCYGATRTKNNCARRHCCSSSRRHALELRAAQPGALAATGFSNAISFLTDVRKYDRPKSDCLLLFEGGFIIQELD